MANEEQVALLKQGVEVWNQWRKENPDISPDLSDANFNHTGLSGADFRRTYLTQADFSYADLCGADFRFAILERADLYCADFRCADFRCANFRYAQLIGAFLNDANLEGADLSDANLTCSTARSTNFTGATLTGACIKDWHINADTKLDDVICDYIYLKGNQQERRPSDPNRTFAPGEFTKLFQKAHETLDLIFRNGVDWQAFAYAFGQLQIENEADELAIASIENKGDGVVVIRIQATPEANRPKLHGDFMQVYEVVHKTLAAQYEARLGDKDRHIDQQDRHINQLFTLLQTYQAQDSEVKKLMA